MTDKPKFEDIEIEVDDDMFNNTLSIIDRQLNANLDPSSYNVFADHSKTTIDELALAIGKAVINDTFVSCVKLAIDKSDLPDDVK